MPMDLLSPGLFTFVLFYRPRTPLASAFAPPRAPPTRPLTAAGTLVARTARTPEAIPCPDHCPACPAALPVQTLRGVRPCLPRQSCLLRQPRQLGHPLPALCAAARATPPRGRLCRSARWFDWVGERFRPTRLVTTAAALAPRRRSIPLGRLVPLPTPPPDAIALVAIPLLSWRLPCPPASVKPPTPVPCSNRCTLGPPPPSSPHRPTPSPRPAPAHPRPRPIRNSQ
jgi:hypothetical protein